MKSGLLATKLHRPSAPPKRLERPHFILRLDEGLESGRQITLVSVLAGFGKTACISDWVDTLNCPVTWLSLDAADDDPGRFAGGQTITAGAPLKHIPLFLRDGAKPPIRA